MAPYPFSTRKNALLAVPTGKLLILSSVTYGLLCFSHIDYNMLWSDLGKQILSPEGSQGRIKEKRMRPDEHLAAVLAAEAAGQEADFLFFWGHQPRPDGTTGPGCLSQWWPAPFSIDDITYPTAEHWMMAAKARLFRDDQALAAVLAANSPIDAKAAGRAVRGYREQDWAAARFDLVVAGSVAKFRQNPDLADFLRGTGRKVLVEASPRDRIWGVGMGARNPDVKRPSRWRGTNLLGFALMNARNQL
ncbi:MAG TPA: NADAR family protein [Streptosporangiaceae bacterium]|nr:NADAR family protein [Streptosporangiaceae bacterium]